MSTVTGLDIHAALAEMHTSFFICALYHCTVSVLMTFNLMYVNFIKSVIPFHVRMVSKLLAIISIFLCLLSAWA